MKSYSHEFPAFSEWSHTGELKHFDFVHIGKTNGLSKMSDILWRSENEFCLEELFFIGFDSNYDPNMDVIKRISEKTPCTMMAWFCDSHYRYNLYDKVIAPTFNYCVTTWPVSSEAGGTTWPRVGSTPYS